jgi:plasmid stability protein
MNKLIRNIPDDVADLLKKQAKEKGLTLEAYMRLILIEAAKSTSSGEKKSGGADNAIQR